MLLKTNRLLIRRIVEDDWKDLKVIWQDFSASEFSQYDIPHCTEDEDVRTKIARWAAVGNGREHMYFAVCFGETMIGYIAFNIREYGYEIGYCFHSDYHGKGYAGESLRALLDYLRGLGITDFIARTAMDNEPSVSLLRSVGFEQIGTEKVSFYKDAEGKDIVFGGSIFELKTG